MTLARFVFQPLLNPLTPGPSPHGVPRGEGGNVEWDLVLAVDLGLKPPGSANCAASRLEMNIWARWWSGGAWMCREDVSLEIRTPCGLPQGRATRRDGATVGAGCVGRVAGTPSECGWVLNRYQGWRRCAPDPWLWSVIPTGYCRLRSRF